MSIARQFAKGGAKARKLITRGVMTKSKAKRKEKSMDKDAALPPPTDSLMRSPLMSHFTKNNPPAAAPAPRRDEIEALTTAIDEQQAQITAQEARIADLEKRVGELTRSLDLLLDAPMFTGAPPTESSAKVSEDNGSVTIIENDDWRTASCVAEPEPAELLTEPAGAAKSKKAPKKPMGRPRTIDPNLSKEERRKQHANYMRAYRKAKKVK